MKRFFGAVRFRVIYPIFVLATVMCLCVLFKKGDEFRLRSGAIMSTEQRIAAYFTALVVVIVTGYISFKTAKADWVQWKKDHRNRSLLDKKNS